MYKVDLHTHSIMSHDGGISEKEYEAVLSSGKLDFVAITDHNRIDFAQKMQQKFGEKIVVGEEISTTAGEIIGLFLKEKIHDNLSIAQTIAAIHAQEGLVMAPHPLDPLRKGIGEMALLEYIDEIDIIEGFNARLILRFKNKKAENFAKIQNKIIGVGSDAHIISGLGSAYAIIEKPFTQKTALESLKEAKLFKKYQPFRAFFAPKFNRLKKLL